MRLFYFNPDTDFALGCKTAFYTPPAEVVRLKNHLRLIQLFVAEPDDIIIVDDCDFSNINVSEKFLAYARDKGVRIIPFSDVRIDYDKIALQNASFAPWGWNQTIKRVAENYLGDLIRLPDDSYIDLVRELAHRRTALIARKIINDIAPNLFNGFSVEMLAVDDVLRFIDENPGAYVKLPWSSSGRGILPSSRFTRNQIEEWTRGALRRQGSVIVETEFPSNLDFASEWYLHDGVADFVGWSVFNTSNKGQYEGNMIYQNEKIENMIFSSSMVSSSYILDIQKNTLERVAKGYDGPVGIDMLRSDSGEINPCVEINFRYTMGHIACAAANSTEEKILFYELMHTLNE